MIHLGFIFTWGLKRSEVAQSCLTLCDPMDCSLPGSSVHGIFQARELEWVAISFSRGSSWLRYRTQVSRIVGRRFTVWPPGKSMRFRRNFFFFLKMVDDSNTIYWEDHPHVTESLLHPCQRSVRHLCVGLYVYTVLFHCPVCLPLPLPFCLNFCSSTAMFQHSTGWSPQL